MITAQKILSTLKEEYYTRIKAKYNPYASYEVFVNPAPKEIREFDGVRFSANSKTKEVLVWLWHEDLHPDLRDKLGITIAPKDRLGHYWSINLLEGVANRRGSKFYMEGSDALRGFKYPEEITVLLQKDWSWVDRYVVVTPFIESYMKKYNIENAPSSDLTANLNKHFDM